MICLGEAKKEHLRQLDRITRAWDKNKDLVKQFGKYNDPNNIAKYQLKELLQSRHQLLWDEDIMLHKDISKMEFVANDMIKSISKIADTVRSEKISTSQAILLPPEVVHNMLPSSKAFLNQLTATKSYEQTARENFQRARNQVADLLEKGFIANGAGKKFLEKSFLAELAHYENLYAVEGSDGQKSRYLQKIKELVASDKGRTLREYMELVEMRDVDFKNRETIGKYNDHLYDAAKKTRNLMGTVDKKGNVSGLAKVLMNSLDRMAESVVFARTNQENISSVLVQKDSNLRNFLEKISIAKKNILESVKDGGYIPHMGLDQMLNLRKRMEGIDFSGVTKESDSALNAASKILERNYTNRDSVQKIASETGTPSYSKQRSQMIEGYFAQNPLFVLDKYANEVIMHNRDSKMKIDYLKALKNLGSPKNAPEFINTMKKYITMQYERATLGVSERPSWINKTVSILNSVEVIKSMGLGMAGATRNFFSGGYYWASQVSNGNREVKLLLNDNKYKKVIAEVESEQGFKFLEKGSKAKQGLDILTQGALSETGIRNYENIDIEVGSNGKAFFVHRDKDGGFRRLTEAQNTIIEKSLFMHRWGENKLRSYMFRTAFIQMYDGLIRNPMFMNKENSTPKKQENKARKFATQMGMEAVSKWAFDYSTFHKAPIISGLAKKPGEKMTGLDYATTIGSVAGLFLHYPMKFAELQFRTLKRASDKALAGEVWNADSKNVLAFAGVYGASHALSLLFNSDFTHLMENDTISKVHNLIDYATEDDPEQQQYMRGILNEFTGPIVQDLIFFGNVAGLYSMPEQEWAKMLIGYTDYYDMTEDQKQRAFWLKISTEFGKWKTKIAPALKEGQGVDSWMMQEFGLYPRSWTRSQREEIKTRYGDLSEGISEAVDPLLQLASDIGLLRKGN